MDKFWTDEWWNLPCHYRSMRSGLWSSFCIASWFLIVFSMSHGESCKALSLWGERTGWWGVVENYYLSLDSWRSGVRFGNQNWKHKSRGLDAWEMMHGTFPIPHFLSFYFCLLFCFFLFFFFLVCSTSIFIHLMLTLISAPFFLFLVMPMIFIVLLLAGRLKVIALASAVGVSAGLITLTVAIMIRWHTVTYC